MFLLVQQIKTRNRNELFISTWKVSKCLKKGYLDQITAEYVGYFARHFSKCMDRFFFLTMSILNVLKASTYLMSG